MLGDSSGVLATPTTTSGDGGGGGGGSSEVIPPVAGSVHHEISINEVGHSIGDDDKERSGEVEADRSFGGNRWPRQETLALLKIRSEMDVAFRDASAKGPLWEEVSRKLKELGYNRSSKKCKEKFENVYKYHKRTREGRSGKQEGKTYRFFDQLEAFETQPSTPMLQKPLVATTAMPVINPPPVSVAVFHHPHSTTVPSNSTCGVSQGIVKSGATNLTLPPPSLHMGHHPTIMNPTTTQVQQNPTNPLQTNIMPSSYNFTCFSPDLVSNSNSSSTSSDVELQGRAKRKRKWKDFFERVMKEVIHKQEEMQRRFLEAIEKREQERTAREESWRMQEMTRISREREILAQERSIAAAKDAAIMAFLQKLSTQQGPAGQVQKNPPPSQPPPQPASQPSSQPTQIPTPAPPPLAAQVTQPQPLQNVDIVKADNGDQSFMPASSSRWPKIEVEALIRLRTDLDSKYHDNGPKGPLWEEISAGMRKLGYNRNAKRCKEKWENINKYFKKVKESNKKRPEDSKTCPYFHQLDALYKEKNKMEGSSSSTALFRAENSVPLMVQPQQQWPPPQQGNRSDSVMEDMESEDHQSHHDEEDDKDIEDEEEDEASGYEIVANKSSSMSMVQ